MRTITLVLAVCGSLVLAAPTGAAVKILPGHYARCPAKAKNINACPDVLLDAEAGKTQLYFQLNKAYCSGLPLQQAGVWAYTPQVTIRQGKFQKTFDYENLITGHEHDANGLGIHFRLNGKFKKGGKIVVTIDGKVTHAETPFEDCAKVTFHESHVLRHVNL